MLVPGAPFAGPPDTPAVAKPSPLIGAMQTELERSFKVLGGQDPRAYFIGYTITDTQRAEVSGSNGALLSSSEGRNRWLQVSVRTGTYTLDNTHKGGEQRMASGGPGTAEGRAPDFSHEQPHKSIEPEVSFTLDRKPWEEKVRAYTKTFRESQDILNSIVTFSALAQNAYLVNTEGTQLQSGQIRYRLELFIQGKAADGMNIERYYNFDWVDPKDAPSDKEVATASATLRKEMEGLVKAPLNEPSVGPALLSGRAAAVFFHQVFGHRAEGHRQKDISEGQTF